MCVYLRAKLQDSGIILTGFGQGGGGRGEILPTLPHLKMNPLKANLD